jgi:hypothetical protein
MTIEQRLAWDIETAESLVRIATAKLEWTRREVESARAAYEQVRLRIARIDAPVSFLQEVLQAAKTGHEAALAGQQPAERDVELATVRLRQLLHAQQQLSAMVSEAG